jgi:hypothetical protein
MISSEKRIAASRANGAKSRCPKTPEGKARSSQNAITHGFFAKSVVIPREDPAAFQQLRQTYLRRFAPTNADELALVEEMVAAQWRGRRASALDDAIHTKSYRRPWLSGPDTLRQIELASQQQMRSFLLHSRGLRTLLDLRRSAPAKQRMENEPTSPFVCATSAKPDEPTALPSPRPPLTTRGTENEPTDPFASNTCAELDEPTPDASTRTTGSNQ